MPLRQTSKSAVCEENQGAIMFQKTAIIVGVSALVCGLFVVNASAKQRHHITHHVVVAAATVQPMKATVGNNPLTIAANSETDRSHHPVPAAMPGNNPMVIVKPK
jgi:hypothetical protein